MVDNPTKDRFTELRAANEHVFLYFLFGSIEDHDDDEDAYTDDDEYYIWQWLT